MKNSFFIIIWFLGLAGNVLGQSVPNTTTFTLQNVVDAVNPTTDDLQDCFNDANSAYFNATYSGTKTELLNFRDYGPHNGVCAAADVTQITNPSTTAITMNIQTAVLSDCALTLRRIYYSTTNASPDEGDSYFDQALTTGSITSTITGLNANTGYYFAIRATNATGSDYSAVGFKFTTNALYTFTTSGTWVCPAGVTSVVVECWGGGGTGGPATGGGARAAGGAGGTYAKKTLTVTPTSSYVYTVGGASTASTTAKVDGNPTFWGSASFATATCAANGGVGGGVNATIGGAAATTAATTGSVGDVIYAGGNGGAGTPAESSGGGGGGAGSGGAGGNATNSTAGTGTANNGGNGGAGVSASNAKNNGSNYGGGGSGGLTATSTDRSGGNGAAGYLRITY